MRSMRSRDPLDVGLITLCIAASLFAGRSDVGPARGRDLSGSTWRSKAGTGLSDPRVKPKNDGVGVLLAQRSLAASTASGSLSAISPAATTAVTLSPVTSPAAGQPGVTLINVTGSNFPSGTISPSQVTVSLSPVSTGTGASGTVSASSVTTIVGSTKRITFQIPLSINVPVPTPYAVSISGTTTTGNAFASSNTAALTINPAASIQSVTPNTGTPGQSLTVTITGSFTNFLQGSTVANFGPGISIAAQSSGVLSPVTVVNATTATAQVSIDSSTIPGSRTVLVATGTQQAQLANGFIVVGAVPAPQITSVVPNSATQGQQNLSVSIIGQFTHFTQGTTTASFGAGVSTSSLTVNSPTSATAVINVDTAAAVGPRTITLTTGLELATLPNALTVVAPTPNMSILCPAFAQQGQQNVSVSLVGQYTHWVQGQTTAGFGTGVAVVSVTVAGPTSATVTLKIAANATIGPHDATVTTGGESVTVSGGFQVKRSLLYVAAFKSGNVVIIDTNTNQIVTSIYVGGAPRAVALTPDGSKLYVTSGDFCTNPQLTVINTATNTIIDTVASGLGSFTSYIGITPDGRRAYISNYCADTMSVLDTATDSIIGVISGLNPPGQVAFSPDGTKAYVPVGSGNSSPPWQVAVVNTATNTVTTTIDVGPEPNGLVISPDGSRVFTGNDQLDLGGGSVSIVDTSSNSLATTITSTGSQTNFLGLTPNMHKLYASNAASDTVTVFDLTTNKVSATIPVGAEPYGISMSPDGLRTYVAANSGSNVTVIDTASDSVVNTIALPVGSGGFLTAVTPSGCAASEPSILSVTPSSAIPGQTISIQVTSQATHFSQGTTQLTFGAGVTVNSVTIANATTLSAQIAISSSANFSQIPVTVTTGTEMVALANGFTILSASAPPALTPMSPNYGVQGQSETVMLTGQNTHFLQGTTVANFGSGTSVVSLTVNSATSATAVVAIDSIASLGPRTVSVTTGTEQVSLLNGFTVVANTAPILTSISPNSGQQGQQSLQVTLTGQATHFSQGITQVSFGSDITVNSSNVAGASSLTATITIPANANLGAHTVTVTTGSEVASLSNGFTVTAGTTGPTISSISPSSGQQGQGGPVAIVGQNTHFVQGTTQVSVGSGITVSNIVVTCPTCLTAQLAIAAMASTGPHDVTVTTGTEVATLAGGFTVQPGTPILTSLNPASGQQGQSLTATITGQFTHFAQGTTQVSFSAGITVSNINVASATSLTAQLAIDPAAITGTRTLTVTTGTEVVSVANVFTIQPATPILYSLNPGGGQQGQQNLPVVLTGVATHFAQGTSTASFGAGVTVVSLTVASATSATAVVNIDSAATQGPRTVTVTTGSEVVSFPNGFTVASNSATLLSLNPGGSSQGASNLPVQITGQGTHFTQGTSVASFGPGITVTTLSVTSATAATATINIDAAAVIGPRTVTVTTGSEVASFAGGFSVVAGVPGITQINPGGGPQGSQNLSLAVTAQFTHFAQGTTTASFSGSGITVVSLTVNSPLTATVVVNVDPAAAQGARDVTLTTGSEVVTAPGGFTVTSGSASLLSASPNTGTQGQQNLSVALTGQLTHFSQGTTTVSFGAGITVTSVSVTSPTAATVSINIDPAAATGARAITVTTGSEVVTLNNGFGVLAGTPALSSVAPSSGQQGQQNLPITVTGQFTHFAQGTTQVSFGTGVVVAALTVTSPTSLSATVNIDPAATVGSRTVTVTTGTEVVTLANGFTIQPLSSGPLTLSPNSAMQSQTVSVAITAVGTHFVQGTTQVRFGAGISVGSAIAGDFGPVTVTSPTTATAQIAVLSTALPSLRTVTMQTGSEQVTGTNAFAVLGTPFISAVTPAAGNQGTSGTATILGSYTHFVQGSSQVSFGAGVTVNSVTVNTSFSLTAAITIASSATPGLRTVTVQIGSEVESANNGFSVLGPVTGPPPTVTITSPANGSEVTALTTVTGMVTSPNLDSWTLQYQSAGSSTSIPFATGTSASVSGTFDPTLLLNGITAIQLSAMDTSGQTTTTSISVVVDRNLKVGLFTVSFNDLSVPVAGLPIQVVRTYDSRRQQVGDFGVGWTLDLKTISLSTSVALGDQWNESSSGGAFPNYCINATQPHVVTVSLTDGTTYEFQPMLNPQCQRLVPLQDVPITITFMPTGNTPPNAALAIAGNNQPTVMGAVPGPVTLDDLTTLATFDPDQYTLTLPDGRVALISRQFGLQSLTDLNSNKLTVTSTGITHSSGKSVTFTRDGQNRITQITDPNGNHLLYAYSATGDLVSFTDPLNEVSTYTYNSTHGLLTIQDPAGVQPIRNDYDANGRLVSHTDAFGNVINYTNVTSAQQEIVTDRLGNVTVNQYDNDGNIIQVTDALGGITKRTYDAQDNLLTETNALGQTKTYTYDANRNRLTETDALGHTTTYTYNGRNQVLTVNDPLGHVTTNTYDANGNLLSTKDPAGNTTTYTYNASGLRTSMTDALGSVTTYQYDASGNLTQQTDALGHSTTYTYDANGNKTSQTQTRTTAGGPDTLVTTYQYDGLNRLTKTTYTDGSTTQIAYNNIGKQSVTTDQLGRQTSYQYDLMGRLTQTTYPDGTSEQSTYDAEGDRITSVDRANRTTTYVYDPLKRLTKTLYPDTASTTTAYDAIGEVTSVSDPLGNTTQYGYDAAGRRTQVTDALSHLTSFAYDAAGNQTSMTDANNNTTRYQYDADNRRTKVIYPDTTSDTTSYDALGRTIGKTDQAGVTTQYGYDKLGRLIQVTDGLNQLTKYTYDEIGERLTQTDANNHTTAFAYDKLGRRTQRTLPAGQAETLAYDAAGNLKTKTDFNGKTTAYGYDSNNRLTSKAPDPSLSQPTVTFAYTATGQRLSMTDASGTTTYSYDLRDRLLSKATPEGTLSYTYDLAGNLTSMKSSNSGGTSVAYGYDKLNRLSAATDNRQSPATTSYTYDAAGNLLTFTYPNAVSHTYTYNTLNRLTNLSLAKSGGTIASYGYTLGPAGNRTGVTEFGGRTVAYTYDNLYRLTGETTSGAASGNGAIGYTYDPVGNRLTRTSTVVGVSPTSSSYDADDRLTSDTYDANGNTTASGGTTYTYDFENHLATASGGVAITYDGDGNRVSKTASGATTKYLVDDRNLTGYAQVVDELNGGAVQRVYTYGLNRISQSQASATSFYEYDGHGNVRLLTDTTGAVTDRYDYDAFGNILTQAGSTSNVYLYSGEQNDPNLGFYYLRARYLNSGSGRFVTPDVWSGNVFEPSTLHKYVFARNNSVNRVDPSGRQDFTLAGLAAAVTISDIISVATPTLVQGAILVTGIELFLDPGFALQKTALEAMASGKLGPIGWAAAQKMYNKGSALIQLGALAINQASQINDVVQLGFGVGDLATAILNAPRLTITAIEATKLMVTSTSIEVTGSSLLIQAETTNIAVLHTLTAQFTNWAEAIFEGTELFVDALDKAVQGLTQ